MIDYNSSSSIKSHLKLFDFSMQKKWGQNFLIDEKNRMNIIEATGNIKEKQVWEVGPGLGSMTVLLKEKGAILTLFEIDRGFTAFLNQQINADRSIKIIQGNVLKKWKEELKKTKTPYLFFSCLPYNISIELVLSFFKNLTIFDKMVITVQKEVADKILSGKNNKSYSPISIFSSYFYEAKRILNIPPSSFWPQPNVTSTCLLLTKREKRNCKNEKLFISLVNALFSSRRRTIKNNLCMWLETMGKVKLIDFALEEANLNPLTRAESLEIDDFINLTNVIGCHIVENINNNIY